MLAAEFGYSYDYVDWCLDMDDIAAHMEYRKKCPPIGALFKAFMEALGGEKPIENTTDAKVEVSNSLEDFIADFTGAGGQMQ